ncbi:MAG: HAD-IA family hydrolase [Anaerolineales bacterium]|jgi:HAD superfamily hydrolase (TIGR01509 family)
MNAGRIRALIFDFDGLVIDTESPIFNTWQELYRSYGLELTIEDWSQVLGTSRDHFDPSKDLDQKVGHGLDWSAIRRQLDRRQREQIADQPLLPGVLEYLQDARRLGLKIGMASSSSCDWVTGHLARLELLEYFDIIRARDDVPRPKPAPYVFESVLSALDLPACAGVVLEDSFNGVRAAKAAGLFCVAVPNLLTQYQSLDEADIVLDSLADVPLESLLQDIQVKFQQRG